MLSSTLILTANWLQNDAVGNDVAGMANVLRQEGHAVSVHVAGEYDPTFAEWLVDEPTARNMLADRTTRLIHHHSIGSQSSQQLALDARCDVRALRYHNITPPHFVAPYDPRTADLCRAGRAALLALVPRATHFLVPSLFNATDLLRAGAVPETIAYQPCFYRSTDLRYTKSDPDRTQALLGDTRLRVLFVGRRSPHKGHRHLISAIKAYADRFDQEIVLHMVGGGDDGASVYDEELRDAIDAAGVTDLIEMHDQMPFPALLAFYRNCDVFLCMSEHEGFCLPVIEAQACETPVIAFAAGGVPEALGPTQPFALPTLDPGECAVALRALGDDPAKARQIGQAGAVSVDERFGHSAVDGRFLRWFNGLARNGAASAKTAMPVWPADTASALGFDAEWYERHYRDVRALGMEPRQHYEWIGRRLGRRPCAPVVGEGSATSVLDA